MTSSRAGCLRPSCARPLGGPRISSAARPAWHRLSCLPSCLRRGTTRPRLCTPVACTSQVMVCLASRGTSHWGHPRRVERSNYPAKLAMRLKGSSTASPRPIRGCTASCSDEEPRLSGCVVTTSARTKSVGTGGKGGRWFGESAYPRNPLGFWRRSSWCLADALGS
jgi:hypothetical protein